MFIFHLMYHIKNIEAAGQDIWERGQCFTKPRPIEAEAKTYEAEAEAEADATKFGLGLEDLTSLEVSKHVSQQISTQRT